MQATRRVLDYLETITASGYFHPEALAQFKSEIEAIERACLLIESGALALKAERRGAEELLTRIAYEVIDRRTGRVP